MKVVCFSMVHAILMAQMASAGQVQEERKLRSTSADISVADYASQSSYDDCAMQNMTAQECIAHLETKIHKEHQVGKVEFQVSSPRSRDTVMDTYWMVGIHSNSYGKVSCHYHDAKTTYPFLWSLNEDMHVPVPSLDCSQLTVGECCLEVRRQGQLIGKDVNDQCLACHVHQAPLEPVADAPGLVHYQDKGLYNPLEDGGKCHKGYITEYALSVLKEQVRQRLANAHNLLHTFMAFPDCQTMETLLQVLYDAALAVEQHDPKYQFQTLLGQLSCGWCYDNEDSKTHTSDMEQDVDLMNLLGDIANHLDQATALAANDDTLTALAEKTLFVYTDTEGTVVEPVAFGVKE